MSEILRIPVDRELSDRVQWLIKLRWLVLVVALGVVLLARGELGDVLPVGSLCVTLGAVAGYNVLFWVATSRLVSRAAPYETHAILMHVQIIADALSLTVILHFSGGLENPFSTFYLLLVVMGSVLMTRRDAYLYATVATFLWIALLLLEARGVLPHYNLAGFRLPVRYKQPIHIIAETLVLGGANYAVAYVSSSIVARLREEGLELYEANAACAVRAGQLAQLNQRLQELDRTRSLFMRVVTHELRAPVAAIQSYLDLILKGYVPEERLEEIIARAEQRARDQLDLISDLLDLTRIQESKGRLETKQVDLASVLGDVLEMMQVRVQSKSLSLTVEAPGSACMVEATEEHVKQVWTNLISNAIKYTPDGGRVAIALTEDDSVVRGEVRDTGIGISPEETERIFETFYRTEPAKAMARGGTGLGLSIVKGIMERYGGRVWVESEVGQGSTFSFEFPKGK